jgi:hypothetical protein
MVYVKYEQQVKVIVVNMARWGIGLEEINHNIYFSVSPESLALLVCLYLTTLEVHDPASYKHRGCPLEISLDKAKFILAALELEPTIYVIGEIQLHTQAILGNFHPLSTITDMLQARLHLTKNNGGPVTLTVVLAY